MPEDAAVAAAATQANAVDRTSEEKSTAAARVTEMTITTLNEHRATLTVVTVDVALDPDLEFQFTKF